MDRCSTTIKDCIVDKFLKITMMIVISCSIMFLPSAFTSFYGHYMHVGLISGWQV